MENQKIIKNCLEEYQKCFFEPICNNCCTAKNFFENSIQQTFIKVLQDERFVYGDVDVLTLLSIELRQQMIEQALERRSSLWCSSTLKKYIKGTFNNKNNIFIDENELNDFIDNSDEVTRDYFILKYFYFADRQMIQIILQKHLYQIRKIDKKIKKHFKCTDFDLVKNAKKIRNKFIEQYNKKIDYNFLNLWTFKWDSISVREPGLEIAVIIIILSLICCGIFVMPLLF